MSKDKLLEIAGYVFAVALFFTSITLVMVMGS